MQKQHQLNNSILLKGLGVNRPENEITFKIRHWPVFGLSTLETQILLKSMELNIRGGENVKNIYKLETDFFFH